MVERIDAQRAVQPEDVRRNALERIRSPAARSASHSRTPRGPRRHDRRRGPCAVSSCEERSLSGRRGRRNGLDRLACGKVRNCPSFETPHSAASQRPMQQIPFRAGAAGRCCRRSAGRPRRPVEPAPGTTPPAAPKPRSLAGASARRRLAASTPAARRPSAAFRFGIEMRCADPGAEVKSAAQPLAVKAKDMLVTAKVWQPTVLTSEIIGPLTVDRAGPARHRDRELATRADAGARPADIAGAGDDRARPPGGGAHGGRAGAADVQRRAAGAQRPHVSEGSAAANPVIEVVLKLTAGSAPTLHAG